MKKNILIAIFASSTAIVFIVLTMADLPFPRAILVDNEMTDEQMTADADNGMSMVMLKNGDDIKLASPTVNRTIGTLDPDIPVRSLLVDGKIVELGHNVRCNDGQYVNFITITCIRDERLGDLDYDGLSGREDLCAYDPGSNTFFGCPIFNSIYYDGVTYYTIDYKDEIRQNLIDYGYPFHYDTLFQDLFQDDGEVCVLAGNSNWLETHPFLFMIGVLIEYCQNDEVLKPPRNVTAGPVYDLGDGPRTDLSWNGMSIKESYVIELRLDNDTWKQVAKVQTNQYSHPIDTSEDIVFRVYADLGWGESEPSEVTFTSTDGQVTGSQ